MRTFARLFLAMAVAAGLGAGACGGGSGGGDPVVFEVSTPDRTTGQDPGGPVEIRFTRDLDAGSIVYDPDTGEGTFELIDTRTGEKVRGTLSIDGDRIVFTPDGDLSGDVVYRVQLSESVAASDGETLGEELALLLSTQAIGAVDVQVLHPTHGHRPKLLFDLCYDVGEGRAFDLEHLRYLVENAETLAAGRTIDWIEPRPELYSAPLLTKFHFWPNLIELTEVYYGDPDLYEQIVEQFLANEPDAAAIQPEILDDVLAGERVVLARDFVTIVQDAFATYHEVHYGFLVNLDAEWVREVLVHEHAAAGLPRLHDPAVDELQALFDDDSLAAEGEVWSICLRANFDPRKYQGAVVDRFAEPHGFHIRRIHQSCAPGGPGDPPPPPWEVVIPPPPPNPPPPGGGDGGGGEGGAAGGPPPPKNPLAPPEPEAPEGDQMPFPWPWPGPEEDQSPAEPGEGADAPTPMNCNQQELAAIKAGLMDLVAETQQKMEARSQDVEEFGKSSWVWDPDATFNDPELQEIFEEYKGSIDPLEEQIDDLEEQAAAKQAEIEALKDALDPALDAARIREDLWDNMITTGGPWSNVRVPCMPPWIPAGGNPFADPTGGGVVIITVEQQAQFQKDVYKGLVRGMSFDDAVNAAIANDHNYPPGVVKGDKIYQLIWKTYAECLKMLYEEMAKIYLPLVYPGATAEQIANAWKVMCEGRSALTAEQQQAYAEFEQAVDAVRAEQGEIQEQIEAVKAEIERLRREYREKALERFRETLKDVEKCRTKMWILQDFVQSVENPSAGDGTFIKGEYFCEVIDEMLAQNPPPCLKKYLEDLKAANCG